MPKRILIADDDEGLLTLMRVKLELSGYSVTAAANGAQALGLAASNRHDVVVADVGMPVMDGFEMLKRLRRVSDVPVIICSGGDHAAEALQLGASDYLAKPFDINELVQTIDAVLKSGKVSGGARSA